MTTSHGDRLVHPAAAAGGTDARSIHPRLADEEVVRGIDVARPFLIDDALGFLRWEAVGPITAAP